MLARLPSPADARPHAAPARRRGVTIVESTLVLSAFLLLLFGMFEYCRFLLILHVTNNAARDGARYASVNVDKPANFTTVDFVDASGKIYPSISRYTRERMGGTQHNIVGFRVAAFAVEREGLALTPAVVRPKSKSTATPKVYPDRFAPYDPNDAIAYAWNSAPFPDRIAVTIDGNYHPILPTFLLMPSSIKINVTSMLGGEG